MVNRRCILVLGMHRSGTSAFTKVIGLLGADLPLETMPATADNPLGYWESPRITRFNNRLLESAGTHWNDVAPIQPAWFTNPARTEDLAEAASLIAAEFPGRGTFVLKDPRICRLLPFWRTVFDDGGIRPHAVLLVRDPLEVARSLAARGAVAEFRPAAIRATDRGLLLWLRYTLDAERSSRDMPRHAVEYRRLLADWQTAVAPLVAAGLLASPAEAAQAAVDSFLDPSLRRQRADVPDESLEQPGGIPRLFQKLLTTIRDGSDISATGSVARLVDSITPRLDELVTMQAGLRSGDGPEADAGVAATEILAKLETLTPPADEARPRSALFLTGAPASIGHVYRVEHCVAALTELGWRAEWLPADDPTAASAAAEADLVVVFRAAWSEGLAVVRARCRERGLPLVYDVDDLIFEPALMADGSIAVLSSMPEYDRKRFVAASAGHREMLEQCDAAILSTQPLAEAASRSCRHCFVLPNALDLRMEAAAAAAASAPKNSAIDGLPRLCFASGTPSHDRDFAVAAEGIARLFARRPEPRLVVIGELDPGIYENLRPFLDRVEKRPRVPLLDLFAAVAGCDINLAPLELGNDFCEAKSPVRCILAAAVGVPTVASPTGPLRDAIAPGQTGFLAGDADEWATRLECLLNDSTLRTRMGRAARERALAQFGWVAYRDRVRQVFGQIISRGIAHPSGSPAS